MTAQLRASYLRWGLIFLGLFLAINWQEVSSPTLNVDDWGLVGDPIRQASQSRPGWDLLYPWLFQSSFSAFLGWLIAGLSLYTLATVTAFFCPLMTPAWVCLLALLVALHTYFLDLFNFSFAIGLYVLPAPLAFWAAVLMGYSTWRPALSWVIGALMVTLAISIYQPTGSIGIGVLGLQALSEALGLRRFPTSAWWRVLSGMLGGSLVYVLWARIAMAGEAANQRSGFADLPRFVEKFSNASVYQEIYSTKVSLQSSAPQFLLSVSFLLILLLSTVWIVRRTTSGAERIHRLGLLWISAGALTLLPLLLFYVLQAGFPSRAFCLANFGIASFSVIVLATLQGPEAQREAGSRRIAFLGRFVVGALVVAYVVPQAAFFSKIWDLTHLLERRDMAMAQAIYANVMIEARQHEVPAESFSLFGTTERNEPFPHWSSVGQSAFRREWSIVAIFRQLLGVQVRHIAYRSEGNEAEVRRSLPACAAFPSPGSIVVHQGSLLVCLESNPAPSSKPS
jgi:hypothetical protein